MDGAFVTCMYVMTPVNTVNSNGMVSYYSLAKIRVFSNKPSLILITCLHVKMNYVTLNGRQQTNISWPLNPKPEDLTQVEKFTLLQKPIAHALFHYRKTLLYLPCLSSFMYETIASHVLKCT